MKEIFAKRLKLLRAEKGLSQFKLALELNLGSGFIADLEQKRTMVSIETLTLICDFFNTTPDYLLGYKDEK